MDIRREIYNSFQEGLNGFVSRCNANVACPPYFIATAASHVVPGALNLPDGYDQGTLMEIQERTRVSGEDVAISLNQAVALAHIGIQLLQLGADQLDPPLTLTERESIKHLVDLARAQGRRRAHDSTEETQFREGSGT